MQTLSQARAVHFRDAVIADLYPATPDARGFFESVLGFSDLADQWFRVSAADQRRYFGRVLFGKCAVKVSPVGIVKIIKTKAFGRDADSFEMFFDHLAGCFRSTWGDNAVIKTPGLSL